MGLNEPISNPCKALLVVNVLECLALFNSVPIFPPQKDSVVKQPTCPFFVTTHYIYHDRWGHMSSGFGTVCATRAVLEFVIPQ